MKEQIRLGQQNRIEHGRWIGLAPLGYRNVQRNGEAQVEIDPRTAPLVQQAFYLAAEGKHPLLTMVRILTERGLWSRRGNPLPAWILVKLLTNPFYVGKLPFKGELYMGLHRPLIDTSLFEKVKRNLARRRRG